MRGSASRERADDARARAIERRRQAAPPRRRPRQGHRADAASPTTSSCRACCTASCCARRIAARAHRVDRRRGAPRRAGRAARAHRQGLPDPLRHPPGQPGRARALHATACASSAIRSPPSSRATRTTAVEALDLIDVEYEPLPTDRRRRRRRSRGREPRIHDYGDARQHPQAGRASSSATSTQALADADRVFEDVFFYQGNTHLPIEQHAAVAALDPDGKLTLWSSTQTPHYVHRALAKVLGMPAGARSASSRRPTAAASAARAIRSTTRSSSPRRR